MKLQKFRKNGKQKGIAIGCVIALLLTIAGVNLYRTFALYKEEKTFNVLRGVVPDFTRVTTTYNVNGKTDTNPPGKSDNYNVNVSCDGATGTWDSLNWKLNVTNKTQKEITCTVTFTNKRPYKETILNGADPVLSGDLVAVKVDPSTGAVTKADTYSEWYNYTKKEWANAIIPTSEAKSAVQSLSAGQTINENQIQSYFVWIPKYSYEIQTLGVSETESEKAFNIKFGTKNTSNSNANECTTPTGDGTDGIKGTSGESGNCAVGDYMTHPAFLAFGGNGLWVGKFETGRKSGALTSSKTSYSTSDLQQVVIKPNQYAWTYTNVSTMYQLAYNYQRELGSHMMKNTEWGAVAYLTNSIYGRCSSSTSCTEVTINSNSSYKTGYTNSSTTYPTSKNASTTGNNTGIYDMSGGSAEYVMGVIFESSDKPIYYSSGFTASNFPEDSRYYDVYKNNYSPDTYTNRILGDATAETKGWNSDYLQFVHSSGPWFLRSGYYENEEGAGVFYFIYGFGSAVRYIGFRLVLAM